MGDNSNYSLWQIQNGTLQITCLIIYNKNTRDFFYASPLTLGYFHRWFHKRLGKQRACAIHAQSLIQDERNPSKQTNFCFLTVLLAHKFSYCSLLICQHILTCFNQSNNFLESNLIYFFFFSPVNLCCSQSFLSLKLYHPASFNITQGDVPNSQKPLGIFILPHLKERRYKNVFSGTAATQGPVN